MAALQRLQSSSWFRGSSQAQQTVQQAGIKPAGQVQPSAEEFSMPLIFDETMFEVMELDQPVFAIDQTVQLSPPPPEIPVVSDLNGPAPAPPASPGVLEEMSDYVVGLNESTPGLTSSPPKSRCVLLPPTQHICKATSIPHALCSPQQRPQIQASREPSAHRLHFHPVCPQTWCADLVLGGRRVSHPNAKLLPLSPPAKRQ